MEADRLEDVIDERRILETSKAMKRGELNWLSILRKSFRDVVLMGFGAWIIWKQVYSVNPNGYLALIGLTLMLPSTGYAIIRILSEGGSPSSSLPPQLEQPSAKSSGESGE